MIHGQEQQGDRRQPLLSVDHKKLGVSSRGLVDRDQAPEEMTFSVMRDHLDEIVKQLLAVLDFPIIIPLVDWDNKPLLGALHEFNESAFGTFHRVSLPCSFDAIVFPTVP
jgi:hypothetical protein